jgi:NAD(P)-dependent dehydrogenase (short-subunit alcohol dehydrogenase family)
MREIVERLLVAYDWIDGYAALNAVFKPLWEPLLKQLSANKRISEDEAWGEFVGGIPFARPQQPEDIGEAVAFLASDRARNITAESANVSGGQFNW